MADLENAFCDLCQDGNCVGSLKYAHKPYLFHFYHLKQYEEALVDFRAREIATADDNDDVTEDDESGESGHSEESQQELSEEDISDGVENEEEQNQIESNDGGDPGEESDEIIHDVGEEGDEEVEADQQEANDEIESDQTEENADVEAEQTEADEEVEADQTEADEEVETDQTEADKDVEVDQHSKHQTNKHFISGPEITSIVSDVKTIMGKSLDFTMAAGVGIMAGIASMAPSKGNKMGASFFNFEVISKTFIGTALAIIGMLAGVKEIINAVKEKPPPLPVCEHCNKCELQQPGCKIFCELCGECDQGSYWKDGREKMHCLRFCNKCNTNCVVCETRVATVKRHHKAFMRNVHGKLSTLLHGTCKEARIIGSTLIIAGIITCLLPGISWSWGVVMIAGSVLANSAIRIIAKPTVRIRCESCNLEEEAGLFGESTGCQIWCQCCGVQEGTGGERYCMALCEDCSHDS